MKRIYYIILSCCLASAGIYAQSVTTSPTSFTALDEVTLTVNVKGTSLQGYTGDVWIWSWIAAGCTSACDAPTNVDPANASIDAAKMRRSESDPDIYSITFIPVDFFGKPPAQIVRIGLKLKSASWGDGRQSDNDLVVNVDPLTFTPGLVRVFPSKVRADDVVSMYLDQRYASAPAVRYHTGAWSVQVGAYDDSGNQVGTTLTLDATSENEDTHYVRVLPSFQFVHGVAGLKELRYRFVSKDDSSVQTDEFTVNFLD